MRRNLIVEIVAISVLAIGALVLVKGRSARLASNPSKSLKVRAQTEGRVLVTAQPRNLKKFNDLSSLVANSQTIVTGTVESNVSTVLQPSEGIVVTDYRLAIEDVLKGGVKSGAKLTVRQPGGYVNFDTGGSAETRMPDYWKQPENGEKYVLFLKNKPDGTFSLVGGPQGLFKLADGTVVPQTIAEDKLMQDHKGKNEVTFVKEVRDAIKK